MTNTEIKPGSRVRVEVLHRGYHQRSYMGSVMYWTKCGKLRVLEEGKINAVSVNPDWVKLVKQ